MIYIRVINFIATSAIAGLYNIHYIRPSSHFMCYCPKLEKRIAMYWYFFFLLFSFQLSVFIKLYFSFFQCLFWYKCHKNSLKRSIITVLNCKLLSLTKIRSRKSSCTYAQCLLRGQCVKIFVALKSSGLTLFCWVFCLFLGIKRSNKYIYIDAEQKLFTYFVLQIL